MNNFLIRWTPLTNSVHCNYNNDFLLICQRHCIIIVLTEQSQSKMSKTKDKTGNRHLTKCASAFSWYKEFTSLGGLTQARASDNRTSQGSWILIFLAGCILTFVMVNSAVQKFLEFDVYVVTDLVNMLI